MNEQPKTAEELAREIVNRRWTYSLEITKAVNKAILDAEKRGEERMAKEAIEVMKPFSGTVNFINRQVMCDGSPIPDESFAIAHWEWLGSPENNLRIGDLRKAAAFVEKWRKE